MTWFNVQRKPGRVAVTIFNELGVGASAEDLIAEIGDGESIEVRMDSPGGASPVGLKLHDFFKTRNVTVEITGRCGSAALVATLGAQRIICHASARLLVHQPVDYVLGNAEHLRFEADALDRIVSRLEAILCDRTKQPLATVRQWLAGDTYFSAAEALAAGLVDEVFTPPAVTAVESDAACSSSCPVETEPEAMFKAWLLAFGKVTVADKAKFIEGLKIWAASNVTTPSTV